jgi:hypothetical protein
MDRRDFTLLSGGAVLAALVPGCANVPEGSKMYGLIGKATCVAGKRDEFIAICCRTWARCPVA